MSTDTRNTYTVSSTWCYYRSKIYIFIYIYNYYTYTYIGYEVIRCTGCSKTYAREL